MNETNIQVQYKTLTEAGELVWQTAKNFWSDAEGVFTRWHEETAEYVDHTHDEIVEVAKAFAESLKAVHSEVQVVKSVIKTVTEDTVL